MAPGLTPLSFAELAGFDADDHLAAFRAFLRSAHALCAELAPTRPALAAWPGLAAIAREALAANIDDNAKARAFFQTRFRPYAVVTAGAGGAGFLTGYYEPRLRGELAPSPEFSAPVLARPGDLVTFAAGERPHGFDPALSGAQRLGDGSLRPYPERAAIEAGGGRPVMWLRDCVEVYMTQVQGSASVELGDGRIVRLAYDGRNGQPYTSIGRLLIESGAIAETDMSLERLKSWLRENGLGRDGAARKIMHRNRSYVFFKVAENFDAQEGPIGGAGVALTALRSIAVDRSLWSYATPFWIEANIPWRGDAPEAFRQLMIAQDTGSAIVGPARADLYFGGGDAAGQRAGAIRHAGNFVVLLPTGARP